MNHRVFRALLPAAVISLALAGCEREPPEVVEQIRAIKTITVTEFASGQTRKYSGIVQATDSSSLSFQVGGNVQEVNVNLGDHVEQGQVLAVLDKKPYELNVQAGEADLQRSNANLEEKRQAYVRQKTLFDKDWVSQAALDQATAAHDSAKSEVKYSTSKLNLAKRDLSLTILAAPFDGTIAEKTVDPFMEAQAGRKLFEINADGAIEVALSIPETSIHLITLGMAVKVSFSTEQTCPCQARITEIGSVASDANAFPVKAGLIDPPDTIKAGMTAEVAVISEQPGEEVSYLVPLTAIAPGEDAQDNFGFVFVYDPEQTVVNKRKVSVRGGAGDLIAVYEGVSAGDVLAVAGVSFLTDKQKVKLWNP